MTPRHRAVETDVKPERKKRGMTPPQGLNVSVSVRDRVQKLCESRSGRPGLLVPNSPYGPKEEKEE